MNRVRSILEGIASCREPERWLTVVTSYDGMQNTWEVIGNVKWDLAVLDESHYIKRASTKRSASCMKLREIARQRMCLTGTPVTNVMFDLFTQLEFLGEGLSGFNNLEQFRSFYGKFVDTSQGKVLVDYANLPLMKERLARLAFIIRKEEALPELPDKLYDVHEVSMTPEQAEFYVKLRDQLVSEIEDELSRDDKNGRHVTVNNILVKLLRLAQVTSGFVGLDRELSDDGLTLQPRRVDRFDPNPKLEALVELLKDKGLGDKTIVWACFTQDVKSIRARLEHEGINCVTFMGSTSEADRDAAVSAFNRDPSCNVFIGNPTAGGTGLNLLGYDVDAPPEQQTTNCNHVIYYSQNWSMTARAQSEDRAHRRGTRGNVRVTDLAVPGTIDEEIRVRVTRKMISAYMIQDVRGILDRLVAAMPQSNGD
jgi:SNF2 family DNA or RNA helicase